MVRMNEQYNKIYIRLDDQRDTLTTLNTQINTLNETINRIATSIDRRSTHQSHSPTALSTILPEIRSPSIQILVLQIPAFSYED